MHDHPIRTEKGISDGLLCDNRCESQVCNEMLFVQRKQLKEKVLRLSGRRYPRSTNSAITGEGSSKRCCT